VRDVLSGVTVDKWSVPEEQKALNQKTHKRDEQLMLRAMESERRMVQSKFHRQNTGKILLGSRVEAGSRTQLVAKRSRWDGLHHMWSSCQANWHLPIDPNSRAVTVWTIMVIVGVLVSSVVAPARLAFNVDPPVGSVMFAFDLLFEIVFLIDIALQFRIGTYPDPNPPVEAHI
jgi:hypothetical protein